MHSKEVQFAVAVRLQVAGHAIAAGAGQLVLVVPGTAAGNEAVIFAVSVHRCFERLLVGLDTTHVRPRLGRLRLQLVTNKVRDSDRRQNTDNRNHDHQLDERKTFVILLHSDSISKSQIKLNRNDVLA